MCAFLSPFSCFVLFFLLCFLLNKHYCTLHFKVQSRNFELSSSFRIRGSQGSEHRGGCVLCCSAVQAGRSLPTFERCLLPPSPGRWSGSSARAPNLIISNSASCTHRLCVILSVMQCLFPYSLCGFKSLLFGTETQQKFKLYLPQEIIDFFVLDYELLPVLA
jgi:hypothetical protein